MKVMAINGSPNKEGNTFYALKGIGDELIKQGIELEIIHIGNKSIRGCMDCGQCIKQQNEQCVFGADGVNECIQKIKEADGLIIAIPIVIESRLTVRKKFRYSLFYLHPRSNKLPQQYNSSRIIFRITTSLTPDRSFSPCPGREANDRRSGI